MPNQYISNDDRRRIIEAYIQGDTASTIARIMGFKTTSIIAIIKKYVNGEPIERGLKGGPRNIKINEEIKLFIKEKIDEDCGISLASLKAILRTEKGINVGLTTINRCISDFSYSFKRVHNIPERRNSDEVINVRATYADSFMNILSTTDESKNFFLDEVGFNVSMRSRRGRSLVGTRAVYTVPSVRSRNISVCCVMSKNGIYHYKAQTRAFNTDFLSSFLDDVLEKFTVDNIHSAVIIMDNVPFHRTSIISQKISEAGHRIRFLPPYSPFLNPIENLFSMWKQNVRSSNPINENELIDNIENASRLVTAEHCNNYYRHMIGFMTRCLLKEPIIDE